MQTLATLAAALGLSTPVTVPGDDPLVADTDLHGALNGVADRLLERAATLTTVLQAGTTPLGEADRLAARLLLSDLSLLVTLWQSLGTLSATRLDGAAEKLADARQVLDRSLRSAS